MMKKNSKKKPLVIIIVFFLLFLLLFFIKRYRHITLLRAQADPNPEGSLAWCADHCKTSPEKNPCNQSETYEFPECCLEIAKSGDPDACGWPDRGYCLDSQCASIPEGVVRKRCGGPKHTWCDLCTTNNCPGFGKTQPTITPTSFVYNSFQSTLPPAEPTIEEPIIDEPFFPDFSEPSPTEKIVPTIGINKPPRFQPPVIFKELKKIDLAISPSLTPSFKINLQLPKPYINLVKINNLVKKPLGFLEYLFKKISYYDQLLETTINNQLKKIIRKR